jgi:hypothetical protein
LEVIGCLFAALSPGRCTQKEHTTQPFRIALLIPGLDQRRGVASASRSLLRVMRPSRLLKNSRFTQSIYRIGLQSI